jgi:hypothetical protein
MVYKVNRGDTLYMYAITIVNRIMVLIVYYSRPNIHSHLWNIFAYDSLDRRFFYRNFGISFHTSEYPFFKSNSICRDITIRVCLIKSKNPAIIVVAMINKIVSQLFTNHWGSDSSFRKWFDKLERFTDQF